MPEVGTEIHWRSKVKLSGEPIFTKPPKQIYFYTRTVQFFIIL